MSFDLHPPTATEVPILISAPHCGVAFPNELKDQYRPDLIAAPDDTDWFVHRLYDFAPAMGMTLVAAKYSRWVIDLNRHPESKPLYADGRIITGLCPTTTFLGEPLYADGRVEIDAAEINRRVEKYYAPYHQELASQLSRLHNKFGKALLWDCHSIRQFVPTIQSGQFPDLILGDADESSASSELIGVVLETLSGSGYEVSHNHPFKGGYITRHFGQPATGIHAFQLEMTKVNYMDDAQRIYDDVRANRMRNLLQQVFHRLVAALA